MRRSRKPLRAVPSVEGSNPSPSAPHPKDRSLAAVFLLSEARRSLGAEPPGMASLPGVEVRHLRACPARAGWPLPLRGRGNGPQPLGRPVQAERPSWLRAGAPQPDPRGARRRPPLRGGASRPAGPRRPAPGRGARRLHDPQRVPAGARDLPPGSGTRRGRRQPDQRARASRRARPPRPDRVVARRRRSCSPPSPSGSGRCGRRRSTSACASVSVARCAGPTSTSPPA